MAFRNARRGKTVHHIRRKWGGVRARGIGESLGGKIPSNVTYSGKKSLKLIKIRIKFAFGDQEVCYEKILGIHHLPPP